MFGFHYVKFNDSRSQTNENVVRFILMDLGIWKTFLNSTLHIQRYCTTAKDFVYPSLNLASEIHP